MTRFVRPAALVCVSTFASATLLFACLSSDNTPSPTASADGGATPSNNDAGLTGGDGASGTLRVASISIAQQVGGGFSNYTASASFGTLPDAARACTTKTFGPCLATRCPLSDAGTPTTLNDSAGTITLTGATTSAVLTFDATSGNYPSAHAETAFFKGGDTITAVGAGGPIPAFTAKTLVAPGDVVFTAPACAAEACPDIDRTADMAVAWTGGGAGNVEIAIETNSDTEATSVTCTFQASLGSGTAPAAAMAMLDQADGTTVTAIEIMFPIAQTTFALGSYPTVSFSVQGSATEGFAKTAN